MTSSLYGSKLHLQVFESEGIKTNTNSQRTKGTVRVYLKGVLQGCETQS